MSESESKIERCPFCKNFKFGRTSFAPRRKRRFEKMGEQGSTEIEFEMDIGTMSGKKVFRVCAVCSKDGLYALPTKLWCIYDERPISDEK